MTLKHLINKPVLLDDYVFVDISQDISRKHTMFRILMSADLDNYDLFHWEGNWVFDRTIDRNAALDMLNSAWNVYQRSIT